MRTLSLKLPDALVYEIKQTCEIRGMNQSSLIREALGQYLHANPSAKQKNSFLNLANDLCGTGSGPKDLSTNKKYLGGFGK